MHDSFCAPLRNFKKCLEFLKNLDFNFTKEGLAELAYETSGFLFLQQD